MRRDRGFVLILKYSMSKKFSIQAPDNKSFYHFIVISVALLITYFVRLAGCVLMCFWACAKTPLVKFLIQKPDYCSLLFCHRLLVMK